MIKNLKNRKSYDNPSRFEDLYVGCRVLLKPVEWYDKNRSILDGNIRFGDNRHPFVSQMAPNLGKVHVVTYINSDDIWGPYFNIATDNGYFAYTIHCVEKIID